MEALNRIAWLLREVFHGVLFTLWVPGLLFVWLLCSIAFGSPWRDRRFRFLLVVAVAIASIPLVLVVLSAVFANESPYRQVARWRGNVGVVAFAFEIGTSAWLVWKARGFRLRFFSLDA